MQTFTQLAKQADELIQEELSKVSKRESALDEKASLLASKEAELDKRQTEATLRESELSAQNEEVSRKLLAVRNDEEVKWDRELVALERKASQEELKRADEKLAESRMILKEVEKRELALSEREKTYKKEIEMEVMKHVAFGR